MKRRHCPSCSHQWDDEEDEPPCVIGNLYAGESIAEVPRGRFSPGGYVDIMWSSENPDRLRERDVKR